MANSAFTPSGVATQSASQTQQEAATATDVFVSPGTQKFHPGNAKAWVGYIATGTPASITSSYNVQSLTTHAAGDVTINFIVAFSSVNYSYAGMANRNNGAPVVCVNDTGAAPTASAFRIINLDMSGTPGSGTYNAVAFFGDQ